MASQRLAEVYRRAFQLQWVYTAVKSETVRRVTVFLEVRQIAQFLTNPYFWFDFCEAFVVTVKQNC